jgi:hypothetical protein
MRLLKYILKSQQDYFFHFSYYDPDYPTSGLTVTGLASVCCILVLGSFFNGKTSRDYVCSRKNIAVVKPNEHT